MAPLPPPPHCLPSWRRLRFPPVGAARWAAAGVRIRLLWWGRFLLPTEGMAGTGRVRRRLANALPASSVRHVPGPLEVHAAPARLWFPGADDTAYCAFQGVGLCCYPGATPGGEYPAGADSGHAGYRQQRDTDMRGGCYWLHLLV